MSLEITYRYRQTSDGQHVEETRGIDDAVPTVSIDDGQPIVAGTLAIVEHPETFDDVGFFDSADIDFSNAAISGLSHQALDDIGTNTHAQIDAHIASSANPHNVTAAQVGLGNVSNLKQNLSASGPPGVNDDATQGYAVGSSWTDTSNKIAYELVDATPGAAVWRETTTGQYTAAQIDAHINDATLHRKIDDSGSATTDLWSASKIAGELATKSDVGHTHTASDVTDFVSAANSVIDTRRGAANGVASLDANQKIPTSQLPALALTNVHVVADLTARDALTVEEGDVAKVVDADGNGNPQTYIYDGSSWIDIQETSDVISVNGKTGSVTLSTSDVGEGANLYYTEARFDARLASKSTSDLSEGSNLYYTEARVSANASVAANTAHAARTDNPHSVTKTQVGLGNVQNTKVNLSAATAPGVGDDSSAGYSVGSLWIDTTNDVAYRCLDASAGAAIWRATTGAHLTAAGRHSTTSSVYTLVPFGSVLYAASATRTVRSAKIIAQLTSNNAAFTFDARLVDVSNNDAVLAEATGLSGGSKQVFSLGSISNVPSSGYAILELQVRRSGTTTGATRIVVYSLDIEYA